MFPSRPNTNPAINNKAYEDLVEQMQFMEEQRRAVFQQLEQEREAHSLTRRQLEEKWRNDIHTSSSTEFIPNLLDNQKTFTLEYDRMNRELLESKKSLREVVEELLLTEKEVIMFIYLHNPVQLESKRTRVEELEALLESGEFKGTHLEGLPGLEQLQAQFEESNNARKELQSNVHEYERHLSSSRQAMSQLVKEKESAEHRARALETQLKELLDKAHTLTMQNEELRKKSDQYAQNSQHDKLEYQRTIESLESVLSEAHEMLKLLQTDSAKVKREKDRKEHQLNLLKKQNTSLLQELKEASETCSELQVLLKFATETFKLQVAKGEQQSNDPLTKKIEDLQLQLQHARNRNSELEDQLKVVRKELREHIADEYSQDRDELQKEIKNVRTQLTNAENENLALLQNFETLQQQQRVTVSQLENYKEQLVTMQTVRQETEKINDSLHSLSQTLQAEKDLVIKKLEVAEQKNQLLEKDLQSNCMVIEDIVKKRNDMKDYMQQAFKEEEMRAQQFDREKNLLESKLHDTRQLLQTALDADVESQRRFFQEEIDVMLKKETAFAHIKELKLQSDDIKVKLAQQCEKNEALTQQHSLYQKEAEITREAMKLQNKQLTDSLQQREEQVIGMQNEITVIAKDLQEKIQILEVLSADFTETQRLNEDKLKIIDKLAQDLAETKQILKEKTEATTDITLFQQQINELQNTVTFITEHNRELQDKVAMFATELQHERLELIDLQEREKHKEELIVTLQQDKQHLLQQLKLNEQLSVTTVELQQRLQESERKVNNAEIVHTSVIQQLKITEVELVDSYRQLEERFQLETQAFEETKQLQQKNLQQLKDELTRMQVQYQQEVEQLQNDKLIIINQCNQLQKEHQDIQEQLEQEKKKEKENRNKLREAFLSLGTNDTNESSKSDSENIAKLKQQLQQKEKENEQLTFTIRELKERSHSSASDSSSSQEIESEQKEQKLTLLLNEKEKEVLQLESQLAMLKEQLQDVNEKWKQEEEQYKKSPQSTELIASLQQQLASTMSRLDSIETHNNMLHQSLEDVHLDDVKETYSDNLHLQKIAAEKELEMEQLKYKDLQKLLVMTNQALQEKSKENELTRKLLAETEKKLTKCEDQLLHQDDLIRHQQQELAAQAESFKKQNQHISELEKQKEVLQITNQKTMQENIDYQHSTELLQSEIKVLQNKLLEDTTVVKGSSQHLLETNKELEDQIDHQHEVVSQLSEELHDLSTQLDQIKRERDKHKKERDSYLEKLKTAKEISTAQEKEIEETERQLHKQLEINMMNKADFDKMHTKVKALLQEKQESDKQHQEHIHQQEEELQELQLEMAKLKKQWEKDRSELEAQKTQSNKNLHILNLENEMLKNKLEETRSMLSSKEANQHLGSLLNSTKDSIIEELQQELMQLSAKYEQAEFELEEANKKLSMLNTTENNDTKPFEHALKVWCIIIS